MYVIPARIDKGYMSTSSQIMCNLLNGKKRNAMGSATRNNDIIRVGQVGVYSPSIAIRRMQKATNSPTMRMMLHTIHPSTDKKIIWLPQYWHPLASNRLMTYDGPPDSLYSTTK